MSAYSKLLNIQTELKAPKSQRNTFGNYNYRNCEDILEAVKSLLKQEKAIIVLTDEVILIGERYYVKATATFTDIESGESVSNSAYAREEENKKGMDGSQITGASSSYARKYALNGLLAIDDTKDSDTTNKGDKPKEQLITTDQIEQLKQLGMADEDFNKMAAYYKQDKIENVTFKQAEETIRKKTKAVTNGQT